MSTRKTLKTLIAIRRTWHYGVIDTCCCRGRLYARRGDSAARMKRMKLILIAMIFSGLVISVESLGEDTEKAMFHVPSVQSGEAKDWCETGKCSATRITVAGYSESVEYVLECVEVISGEPSPHLTVVCDHVHANNDYVVRIYAGYVGFGEPQKSSKTEPTHSLYTIVSEKERNKHKQ